MSDGNSDLIDKMADIPLSLSVQFSSKVMRLEELLGADESKYRNRQYMLKSFAGKKGKLMLCNTELSAISVAEDGDALNIVIEKPDVFERLTAAITYGDLTLAGTAGRAVIPASDISLIRSGSIIALEQSPDAPVSVFIPDIDYVVYRGEAVTVDEYIGIRITDSEGYFRQDPSGNEVVSGDALLGSMTINPDALGMNGIGTIIKFENTGTPMFFRLSDGTLFRGFLQCFSREELLKNPMLVNELPVVDGSQILTFWVTSVTGPEAAAETGGSAAADSERCEAELSAASIFAVLPDIRVENLLASLPLSVAVWLLKAVGTEYSKSFLLPFCLSLSEDERGSFLDAFVSCRPAITPPSIRQHLLCRLASFLDGAELAAAEAYAGASGGYDVSDSEPVAAALEVFNAYGEYEKQLLVQWLEIAGSPAAESISEGLFMFKDIALLSDRNIQILLREIDSPVLGVALSGDGLDSAFIAAIQRNMSERAWKIMADEISFNKSVAMEKRNDARNNIVRILAKLEDNGSIAI